jgi:hypothetical protein
MLFAEVVVVDLFALCCDGFVVSLLFTSDLQAAMAYHMQSSKMVKKNTRKHTTLHAKVVIVVSSALLCDGFIISPLFSSDLPAAMAYNMQSSKIVKNSRKTYHVACKSNHCGVFSSVAKFRPRELNQTKPKKTFFQFSSGTF